MDRNSAGFMYLKNKLPRISDTKIKEGVFVILQIRELIENVKVEDSLRGVEKQHGSNSKMSLPEIIRQKTVWLVAGLVHYYKALRCKVSLKVHFLQSHIDFFLENFGAVSDEHGVRFHQDISSMEKWHQGKWSPSKLADYCWALRRDVPQLKYGRKSSTVIFR